MAEKITKKSKMKNMYKAMDGYATFMPNKGLLSEGQHESLLSGNSVDLTGTSLEQMQYLISNNLIEKGE